MVPVYLCERNHLQRGGIKSLLINSHFSIVAESGSINDLDTIDKQPAQLILIGLDRQTCPTTDKMAYAVFIEEVKRLRLQHPDARVVMLVSEEHLAVLPDITLLNADGYILKETAPDALVNYLNLALMGEKVLPSQLAMLYANGHRSSVHPLSEREKDIIKCLTLGQSNKLIARHLAITEYTVKVHLKTILRKLGVKNRTQAALWAIDNGFESMQRSMANGNGYAAVA